MALCTSLFESIGCLKSTKKELCVWHLQFSCLLDASSMLTMLWWGPIAGKQLYYSKHCVLLRVIECCHFGHHANWCFVPTFLACCQCENSIGFWGPAHRDKAFLGNDIQYMSSEPHLIIILVVILVPAILDLSIWNSQHQLFFRLNHFKLSIMKGECIPQDWAGWGHNWR